MDIIPLNNMSNDQSLVQFNSVNVLKYPQAKIQGANNNYEREVKKERRTNYYENKCIIYVQNNYLRQPRL